MPLGGLGETWRDQPTLSLIKTLVFPPQRPATPFSESFPEKDSENRVAGLWEGKQARKKGREEGRTWIGVY